MQLDFGLHIGKDISQYGKKFVKIPTIIGRFRPFNGWIESLSSGLLTHSIIPPGKLAELLEHVNMELIEHFKEYELAMTEIHQYYDLPLVSYSSSALSSK